MERFQSNVTVKGKVGPAEISIGDKIDCNGADHHGTRARFDVWSSDGWNGISGKSSWCWSDQRVWELKSEPPLVVLLVTSALRE